MTTHTLSSVIKTNDVKRVLVHIQTLLDLTSPALFLSTVDEIKHLCEHHNLDYCLSESPNQTSFIVEIEHGLIYEELPYDPSIAYQI